MSQRPFGNDFLVATPALDQLHNQLYAEQKSRELQRQRDISTLDDEFSKNVAQIKDADVDDLTAAYSDYKQSTQALMKQKGGANPQQQLELLRKKAAMYKLINESKAEKESIALLGKAIRSDSKGIYDEKAAARLATRLRTPTSKYGTYSEIGADGKPSPVDLRDENGYLYKLGASDFSKDFDAARGKDRDLTPDDKVADPKDPLNFVVKQYKGKNNAIEFYNSLLPRVAGSKEQKDFVLRTELEYPSDKAAALEARYRQLVSDPSYRKRYGLKDNDELPLSSYDSPVARAVRLKAMEHAVNSPIIEKVEKYIPNKDATVTRREKFAREIQDRIDNRSFSLANMRRSWQVQDQETQDEYVTQIVETYKNTGKIDPLISSDYEKKDSKGHTVPIEKTVFSPDGKTVDLIVTNEDGGVDEYYSTRNVPVRNIEARVKKELGVKVVKTGKNTNPKTKPNTPKKGFVFPNGKTQF